MSIPSMMSALAQGYSAKHILDWVSSSSKKIAKNIKSAKTQGYDDDQILTYLTKGQYASHGQKNQMLSGMSQFEKGSKVFTAGTDLKPLAKGIATVGGLAAGAGALMPALKGARGLLGGLQGAFGGNRPTPNPGPAPMANAPGGLNQQVTPPPPAPTQPGLAAQAMPQQPQGTLQNAIINPNPMQPSQPQGQPQSEPQQREIMLNKLSAATPEFKEFAVKAYDEGSQKSVDELFRDFHKEKAKKRGTVQNVEETPAEVKKNSFVATPGGIEGHVQSIKDTEALVKDDSGKIHKVKADELIESPLPEKDLADLHDELIAGIEKETGQEVSRNVFWAGYDPERNSLSYIPHGSGLYIYDDINAQDAAELTSVLNRRKTSGNNFIGAWTEGTQSPIGSAMFSLIKRLQSERGGKGNEYSHKFEPIYSAFEPATNAAKKKKKAREKEMKKKRPHG